MKKVLITGATGGIGKSLVDVFYKAGYFVILIARNKEKLNKLSEKYKKNCKTFVCNLSDEEAVKTMAKQILEEFSVVDVLINNAGVTDDQLFIKMDSSKWDTVINLNLKSNFVLTNKLIRPMIKNKWGRIINITSVVCHTGNPGQANYCASKSGIIGMSKSIAIEVAKKGVTVNCISPGFIETEMTLKLNDDQKENILKKIPMGKVGKVEDVANCAIFLASSASEYITGQTIHVNGGITMI